METPYRADNLIQAPLEHYSELFKAADPTEIAERTGIPYENGVFTLNILGETKTVHFPDFEDEGWGERWKVLAMRYLLEGKKVSPTDTYATYSEMPWGDLYNEKFRQRCILRLAGTYGFRIAQYRAICEGMGAEKVKSSGDAYEFTFMKDLKVRFILWEGDDEFQPTSQILFSDNFPDAFSAEDRVVVCEYILGAMKIFSMKK